MAKNYGDVALQKEGAVTGFVVHNPPANLDVLTSLVENQINPALATFNLGYPAVWHLQPDGEVTLR